MPPSADTLLPSRYDEVTVEGPEAEDFLQGQLSQSIAALEPGGWAWSFVLAPDGKLGALVRIHRTAGDRFVLVVDAGFGEAVHTRLSRFRLRTDCEICLTADTTGPGADDLERIEAGLPAMGVEIEPGDLAASSGMVDAAVDFTKGCFVGQELVARMHSRGGSAPVRLVRLRGDGVAPGVSATVSLGDLEVGSVTSSAASASGWVALAKVSRKLDRDVARVGDVEVRVEELG